MMRPSQFTRQPRKLCPKEDLIFKSGDQIRKNCKRKLQEAIAQESFNQGVSCAKLSTDLKAAPPNDEDAFVKVLGMNWNTVTDESSFDFPELSAYASSLPLSKRSVLKITVNIIRIF